MVVKVERRKGDVKAAAGQGQGNFPFLRIVSKDGSIDFVIPSGPLQSRLAGRSQAFFELKQTADGIEIGDEKKASEW